MTDDQKKPPSLLPPVLVDNQAEFQEMLGHLRRQTVIAIDTESDSLFSYYTKVCLIQISASVEPGQPEIIIDYLVDPLALSDISQLNDLCAAPDIELIMHAAYNDILTLQREYEFAFKNIFDTQLTARILGWERTGLAPILKEQFGVISDKRMQRTDWGKRPLDSRQTQYAQLDTHYLLRLREMQLEELESMERLEEAQEAFDALEEINYHDRPIQERTFWQMKAIRDIPRERAGILQELWKWREKTAQKLDRPPFKVANDSVLVQLASDCPKSRASLDKIKGLSQHQRQRFGKAILQAVRVGLDQPTPIPPSQKHKHGTILDDDVSQLYESLRNWRTQRARSRGVDPDIVFSNDILLMVAKLAPQTLAALNSISEIGPWKAKTYGPEMIEIVQNN